MTTPRTTQLAQSSQAIVSAVVAAGIDELLVMAVIIYANYVSSWGLSIIALFSLAMAVGVILLITEVVRGFRASEKQRILEERWANARGNTMPHAAIPMQQPQNGHRPIPVQFKDASSWQ